MTEFHFYITEGIRHYKNSRHLKNHGFDKYHGNAQEICRQIINDCWNDEFFQASTTNFPQFWTRDFGMCTESLIRLGHKEKVRQTLHYALTQFQKYNKITTTITPKGVPFDVFTYAIDSLAWLLHSLVLLNDTKMIEQFSPFIEKEVLRLFHTAVNKETGLILNKRFSSIKDFAIRNSSCYDNCMLGVISSSLKNLKLPNPLSSFNYNTIIIDNFWNGNYFYDDITRKPYVAADANIFPFYFKIINDKHILKKTFQSIHNTQLDEPFPLKYTQRNAEVKFIPQELMMNNYERDSIWLHIGLLYIAVLQTIDSQHAQLHIEHYTKLIETFGTFPEVLFSNSKPFTASMYHCDQGMLWCANYLTL